MTLLTDWAWGQITASGWQRTCNVATQYGGGFLLSRNWRALGATACTLQTAKIICCTNSPSKLLASQNHPEPIIVKLPLLTLKSTPPEVEEVELPIFLIQKRICCIGFGRISELNSTNVTLEQGVPCRSFGLASGRMIRASLLTLFDNARTTSYAIPGQLHGDGVPYGMGETASLDILSHIAVW